MKPILPILTLIFSLLYQTLSWCEHARMTDVAAVTSVDYSPDGTMMLSVAGSRVTIWGRVTKNVSAVYTVSNAVYAKFSPQSPSTYIAISKTNSDIEIISATTFAFVQSFNAAHGGAQAAYIDWTAAGLLVTCGGTNNKLKTWNVVNNPATTVLDTTLSQSFTCASLSATQIGTAQSNNKLQLQTITSASSISNVFSKSISNCNQIAFSPNSLYMIAACDSGGANGVFITITGATQVNVVTAGVMTTVAYAGDGDTFCYGGANNFLYIVNGTSANKTIMSQFLQTSPILDSDFTNNGLYLVVGTQDGTIYQYAKYCLSCRPGWYTNLTTKACVQCETTMQGCAFCSNSTYCVQCYQNFIINTATHLCTSCATLFEGCGTCFNSSMCRYCLSGYYLLTNYTCGRCEAVLPGCYTCNSSSYCVECQSDFYLDSTNVCIGCEVGIANCIKCVNGSYCTSCKIGFYHSNAGVCTVCPTNCYACQSATNCTDCVTGYYAFSSGGSVTCTKCGLGCLACNATAHCKDCADQRYLDSSGACALCPYPCLTCNTSAYCLSCETAYFYDGIGGCTQCSTGCTSCNASASCLACSSGYYLDIPTLTCKECQLTITMCMECTNTSCLKCQIGFYLASATTCSSCIASMPACIACTSATVCQFCAAGYYKTASSGAGSCEICTLGCATCRSSTNCSSCNVGYYLNTGTNTCNPCVNNCIGCTNTTYCLECEIGYRLGTGGTCVACSTDITGCQSCLYNYTAAAVYCISCQLGRYLVPTTGACSSCPLNCTSCTNSTACTTCEIGMYVNSAKVCTVCQHNCSECSGSATNCSACIAGYYLTSGFACLHCSAFGCATCNSTTHDCLSCQLGFYLKTVTGPPTKICDNCLTAISNCYICTSATVCKQCGYGYALASNSASCTPCSVIEGCKHCTNLSSCQNCQVGYYLVVNGSGFGSCVKCSVGCKDCDSTGVCLTCFAEYHIQTVATVVSCKLCELSLMGCQTCSSSSVCTVCLSGYYVSANTCHLCSQSIFACRYCNSSTVCTACLDGFYRAANNLCLKCQTTMVGCQLCNSSSVCLACEYGMYLNSNQCYRCTTNLPNCIYCLNLTTCLQCDSGSYLSAGACLDCEAQIRGCVLCNSATECLQCKGGYFLNSTTHLCQACQQEGCEICLQSNSLGCLKCNSRFYYNASLLTCVKCRSELTGCLECTNSTRCSKCDPGYYADTTTYQCLLCQDAMYGCGRCITSSACLQCKSTYYLWSTNNSCVECKATLEGCSHCINATACQSCYHGYYMNASSLCVSCTELAGCLSCLNSSYCQYCQNSYFLEPSQSKCYPCSALEGCYACTTNITCSICGGGYILNDQQKCQVMRVQSHETIKDLKLVTKFFNSTCLIHYLYAKDMLYNKSQGINWTKTTKLVLEDVSYKQTKLTILKVEWETSNGYTLIFYTDNPLQLGENSFPFARRRLLLTGAIASKYKVNLQMDQKTINEILPDFYMPKDLVMDYDISSPQFVMSYANANPTLLFYSIFGYVITCLFIIKYILKATCSVPGSAEMGDLIPQVLALKAPAFMIYPTFMEFVYYCSGFMIPDFPWTNQFFGKALADHSDTVVQSYALFFTNMHIGSTYMLAFILIIVVGFIMWLAYNSKTDEQKKQGFPIGHVMFNIFLFGAAWAGCACLQGALLNPIQSVNLNTGFYMIGIAMYCGLLAVCLYFVVRSRKNMYKLRIFVKASLLSAANISPIYIFCSSVLIDIVLILLQHWFSTLKRMYPKIWIVKNMLCNLALCVLVFMPSIMLSLIIASFFIVVAFLIDLYTHAREYKELGGRKKFQPESEDTVDVNIWNINFQKDNAKFAVEEVNDDEESKSRGISDPARRTGFQSTHATFKPQSKESKSPYKRRQQMKIQDDPQQPDIIDPKDPRQVQKNPKNEDQDDGNIFVAQKYLK